MEAWGALGGTFTPSPHPDESEPMPLGQDEQDSQDCCFVPDNLENPGQVLDSAGLCILMIAFAHNPEHGDNDEHFNGKYND